VCFVHFKQDILISEAARKCKPKLPKKRFLLAQQKDAVLAPALTKNIASERKVFSMYVENHANRIGAPFYFGWEKGSERGHCYCWEFNSMPAMLPKSLCFAVDKRE
jgi:hypothetical protein